MQFPLAVAAVKAAELKPKASRLLTLLSEMSIFEVSARRDAGSPGKSYIRG
jgi:hypothetical protein